jgi:chromate reductase
VTEFKQRSDLEMITSSYKDLLDVQIYDGISTLPHFNPDITTENFSKKVRSFLDLIQQAEDVIICTPEYVFSIPGSLKNALEWTVFSSTFSNKPTAIIVASGLGEKAFESLELVMKTIEAKMRNHSKLLIQ